MKTITFTIDAKGNVRAETQGYTGAECLTASRPYETAIGQMTSDRATDEMYQQQLTQEERADA